MEEVTADQTLRRSTEATTLRLCGSLSRYASPLGAAMHNAGYRALGLDWCYVPFEVTDLSASLNAMRTLAIRGLGISMPFKREIMPLLDGIDPRAERIGAVNTVVNNNGQLQGYNTDVLGAPLALAEHMRIEKAPVLVLGAGGAARAVAIGIQEFGGQVTLCNRSEEKAKTLAEETGCNFIPFSDRKHLDSFAAVVNATSAGMDPLSNESLLDETSLHADLVVMDIVYKPLQTRLVRMANKKCKTTISGERMLLHQAAAQFELYTNQKAPLSAMENGLLACMESTNASKPLSMAPETS